MERDAFEELVASAFERLPAHIQEKVRNVAFVVEDEPSPEERSAHHLHDDETLLGLYTGVPLTERDSGYGVGATMPDLIHVYQKPIEAVAREEERAVADVVYETVWHEVAHYFGMDEAMVRGREREREE